MARLLSVVDSKVPARFESVDNASAVKALLCATLLTAVLPGCGAGAASDDPMAAAGDEQATPASADTPAPEINMAGRRLRWVQKGVIASEAESRARSVALVETPSIPEEGQAEPVPPTPPVPVALVAGHEYMADADSVSALASLGDGASSAQPARASSTDAEPSAQTAARVIQGNRYPADQATRNSFPYRVTGYLSNGCTAALVNLNTVITAGHCIYDKGSWSRIDFFAPAADMKSGDEPYGRYSGNKNLIVNNLWMQGNGNFDYGFIQFLDSQPDPDVGFLMFTDSSTGNKAMAGYPSDKNGEMWVSPGKITSVGDYVYKTNMDAMTGNSGSPVFDTGMYMFGNAVHVRSVWSCSWWSGCKAWSEAIRYNTSMADFGRSLGIWW